MLSYMISLSYANSFTLLVFIWKIILNYSSWSDLNNRPKGVNLRFYVPFASEAIKKYCKLLNCRLICQIEKIVKKLGRGFSYEFF